MKYKVSPNIRLFWLILVFILGFGIPLVIALQWGGVKFFSNSKLAAQRFIPNALAINSAGVFLTIDHAPELIPDTNSDFVFIGWFSLDRLPAPKERFVLASKYSGTPEPNDGFALAVQRIDDEIRPAIYWGSTTGGGRWYDFTTFPITTDSWFCLALSLHKGRYLGLYAVSVNEKDGTKDFDSKLLGGYDLNSEIIPDNTAALVIGAPGKRPFRGSVGPIGVFSGKKISESLQKLLKRGSVNPATLATLFDSSDIKLWIPAPKLGAPESKIAVHLVGARGNRKKGL